MSDYQPGRQQWKDWLNRSVSFIMYSSVFISLCAVALCIETNLLLQGPVLHPAFYVFVFCATLLQYNLHYYPRKKDPGPSAREQWSHRNRKLHFTLIVISIAGIVFSLFYFRINHFLIVALLGLITFVYSFPVLPIGGGKRLKDSGIAKLLTITLIWTIITVWFPADEAHLNNPHFWLLFIRRFLFMLVLCLAFDIRDILPDYQEGIRTLPILIGKKNSYRIIYSVLALFVIISLYQFHLNHQLLHLNAMILSAGATFA
ncbi:MAG TPA: UbiA family prenyltransferase, partial [Parasegetibacter sp.]